MSQNISEREGNVQPLEAHQAHSLVCLQGSGNSGDGDWPPVRTYWEGYTEGRDAGEAHGRRLSEIDHMFAVDDAERRGYERGRRDGIDECGWPRFWRDAGSVLAGSFWWLLILGLWFAILADTFQDGKKAGRDELLKQSSSHDKIGMMIQALPGAR